MQHNTDRILTTHVGSLPRTDRLLETMASMQQHDSPKPANYDQQCDEAVTEVVRKQVQGERPDRRFLQAQFQVQTQSFRQDPNVLCEPRCEV